MAPLTPHWTSPSHPDIQELIINPAEFTSMSRSRVALPPFALFARMSFPPCTLADAPTYATVQVGRDRHLNLNSDLLYINHSCEPSLIFDTASLNILVGPRGIKPGDELTFFYPSTEWHMAQPFDCLCRTPSCRGTISGADAMSAKDLEGLWINGHILDLLAERDSTTGLKNANGTNGKKTNGAAAEHDDDGDDPTAQALKDALRHAERVVGAAKTALASYRQTASSRRINGSHPASGAPVENVEGAARRGTTSREMSGEMGGDTM